METKVSTGTAVMDWLLEGGYDGDVYLINPKRSELFGRKAYPNISEVGAQVDLAMIVVAPRFLVSAVADSVKMGVKGVIIITAGLGETGTWAGGTCAEKSSRARNRTGARRFEPKACDNLLAASPGPFSG